MYNMVRITAMSKLPVHKLKENKAVVFVSRREIDDGGRNCNHPVQDAFITTVQLQFII